MASARWPAASAAAAVAGRGGMYVCVESDAALLAGCSYSIIRQDLPQEGETSSRSGLKKGSREETNERDVFWRNALNVFH